MCIRAARLQLGRYVGDPSHDGAAFVQRWSKGRIFQVALLGGRLAVCQCLWLGRRREEVIVTVGSEGRPGEAKEFPHALLHRRADVAPVPGRADLDHSHHRHELVQVDDSVAVRVDMAGRQLKVRRGAAYWALKLQEYSVMTTHLMIALASLAETFKFTR